MKAYVCEVNSLPFEKLNDLEKTIQQRFAETLAQIDPSSSTVEFDLASVIGRTVGVNQCKTIYGRCPNDFSSLSSLMQQKVRETVIF